MSKKRYKDHAKKREIGGFVALPHAVLRSAEFAALSPFAVKALMDLLAQYRGDNNGDLSAAWSAMAQRGWRSRDSLGKGIAELRDASFIVVTRQGAAGGIGKKRVPTLYGVTCYEVDWCAGKLDVQAPSRVFMGTWRRTEAAGNVAPLRPKPAISVTRRPCQSADDQPAGRVKATAAA
ncbi:MAG TPA: hypothetical protein VFB08_02180 [Burkholderiales bacterium]|nr:hypothetical protein [Burkholderiales bacterium]